jgi:hypothetical protein
MITAMSKSVNRQLAFSPSWQLQDDVLVEHRSDGKIRLWGRWDRQFGCWNGTGQRIVPGDPVLGRLGTWFEPSGQRDDSWYDSRSAIAAHWSIVPTTVRLAASQKPSQQWMTLFTEWHRRRGGDYRSLVGLAAGKVVKNSTTPP